MRFFSLAPQLVALVTFGTFVAFAGVSGCEKQAAPEQPSYGEPIGITMEASRDLPALDVAIAVNQGVVTDPLVLPLMGLLHKTLRGCPEFVKAAAADPSAATQVAFTVEQGKVKDAVMTGSLKGSECITTSLAGQELPNLDIQREATAGDKGAALGKLHVAALLRFSSAEKRDSK